MQLEYSELLHRYEVLRKSLNGINDEMIKNGIVIRLNPKTVEGTDIHSSIFENNHYFDGCDVSLDFTEHDMIVINEYKNSKGDKPMEKSKIVETVKKLEEELSVLTDENKRLRNNNKLLEEEIGTLRTRCTDSARDMFDKKMYGCLSVVRGRKELDCGLNFDSPLDFAKSLIEHRTHIEERAIENAKGAVLVLVPEHDRVTFDFDELEKIAEYLLTYCKHNKEDL